MLGLLAFMPRSTCFILLNNICVSKKNKRATVRAVALCPRCFNLSSIVIRGLCHGLGQRGDLIEGGFLLLGHPDRNEARHAGFFHRHAV